MTAEASIPVYFTRFIGRRSELETVRRLIVGSNRLVTLVGIGGSGKTRLAVELVGRILAETVTDSPFPDGVRWVDLAAVGDPGRLVGVVAEAVGLRQSGGLDVLRALARSLADSRILLVLDNCEEETGACQRLADVLLSACPHLVVLATSRIPLGAAHEKVVVVSSLSATASL